MCKSVESKWIKENIERLDRVEEAPENRFNKQRMDRNERTVPFNERFMETVKQKLSSDFLTNYPEINGLYCDLSRYLGNNIAPENIFFHTGSDLVIKSIFETFIAPGDWILVHKPSYAMYSVYANMFEANAEIQEYDDSLGFDMHQYVEKLSLHDYKFALLENPNGFIGNYYETKYKSQYENVYATESRLIYDFVNWVKQQDFYDNTTIVIVGDHISMQTAFFRKRGAKDRYVYNCIINPAVKTNRNKNRIITALDIYPTTVSAIGGIIDGDRLGLGSNLFSNKKTLAEEYGVKYLDKELQKRSDFYNNSIVNDEYLNKFKLEESR